MVENTNQRLAIKESLYVDPNNKILLVANKKKHMKIFHTNLCNVVKLHQQKCIVY